MLTFGKGVVTSWWKEDSPTAGTSTAGRGYAPSLNPLLAPVESRGEGKEETAVLALTWSAGRPGRRRSKQLLLGPRG